ncbi:MAG: tRNA-dihydrouridine synthase family protein [Phycisphaerales bacterium]|nr:tRNA-dihydrouridine synthase family protein [Phycisphaerales bacterium]
MSVELDPSGVPPRVLSRPVEEIARSHVLDPRIPETVPGFDAPFFQAGLAGYSDGAMRLIARRHGCPFCITEALLDRTLINGGKGRRREDPDLIASECGLGDIEDNQAAGLEDHPIAGQVMGTEPEEMAEGAAILAGMGYDMIDVNLACPVKKIRKRNRGGNFLAHPDQAIDVLRAVREAVDPSIPCSVKLRRAYNDTPEMARNFDRIFDFTYDVGYAWATVHCRTVEQRYKGPGRWEFLAELVERRPDRVIFGSGDIWNVEDIYAMLEVTGVHAVSVARGCIGNPWVFRNARAMAAGEPVRPPSVAEQRAVLEEHLEFSRVLHGERVAGRLMRKFGIKFAVHHDSPKEVKAGFVRATTLQEWHEVLDAHYPVALERGDGHESTDESHGPLLGGSPPRGAGLQP